MSVARSRQPWHDALAPLLNEQSPADALASYYAFHHPLERTELFIHHSAALQRPDGFLIRARTGMDLFRPLVTFRSDTEEALQALFTEGLIPLRPYYLVAQESLRGWVDRHLQISDAEVYRIYRFAPLPVPAPINVLLVTSLSPDGTPRAEIRSATNKAGAVAGVNWMSPRWAEVYVHTDPAARGRGWGKAVVAAVAQLLIEHGRTPLYVTGETNEYSVRLAEAVGFEDTGYREYVAQAVRAREA